MRDYFYHYNSKALTFTAIKYLNTKPFYDVDNCCTKNVMPYLNFHVSVFNNA